MAQAIPTPANANDPRMHVHSRDIGGIPGGPARPEGAGWRVEVNLRRGQWRWVRRYGNRRQWTPYYALDSVPGGLARIQQAQAESERQRQLRIAAWSKR